MAPTKEQHLNNIYETKKRIENTVLVTPLLLSDWLSEEVGAKIFFKLESEQITGSFKLRGACNKISMLNENDRERLLNERLVTASSGNHGIACGYVVNKLGLQLEVFSYVNMSKTKEEKISKLANVSLTKVGNDCCESENFARAYAIEKNLNFISPYNDLDVVYGQATIGLEILEQCPDLDAVLVPVGGGGLISGVALAIKLLKPSVQVIGCQPKNDCCMYESVKAGRILEDNLMDNTFASGTAGRVEQNSITFEFCQQFVDDWIIVEEEEIEKGVFDVLDRSKKLIEGAAGLAVASARKLDSKYQGKSIALVICGSNLGMEDVKGLLDKFA